MNKFNGVTVNNNNKVNLNGFRNTKMTIAVL